MRATFHRLFEVNLWCVNDYAPLSLDEKKKSLDVVFEDRLQFSTLVSLQRTFARGDASFSGNPMGPKLSFIFGEGLNLEKLGKELHSPYFLQFFF